MSDGSIVTENLRPYMVLERDGARSGSPLRVVVDGLSTDDILKHHPTPIYVTSIRAFEDRLRLYKSALSAHFPRFRVYYAMKANWSLPLVDAVVSMGEGFDIVSLGELRHLERKRVDPERVCFAGVGKGPAEIEAAISSQVGIINVEHPSELILALDVLKRVPSRTAIALRLNPCLNVDTHSHLRTGALDSKFGMLSSQILSTLDHPKLQELRKQKDARGQPLTEAIRGVHIHVGSQLLTEAIFSQVVGAVVDLCGELLERGISTIDHLDFGGGLGVGFAGVPADGSDVTNHVQALATALQGALGARPDLQSVWGRGFEKLQVCLEPGRSLVASSTLLLTKVLYTRCNDSEHRFAYVDAGMNDFPRPSIYGASHQVVKVKEAPADSLASWRKAFEPRVKGGKGLQIVGPVCESADVLSRNPELEFVDCGDTLAFLEAGAYCRSMASEYNLRSLPKTIFIRDGQSIEG